MTLLKIIFAHIGMLALQEGLLALHFILKTNASPIGLGFRQILFLILHAIGTYIFCSFYYTRKRQIPSKQAWFYHTLSLLIIGVLYYYVAAKGGVMEWLWKVRDDYHS